MSTVIVAIIFLALIIAMTVYSLKRRSSCGSCRRCSYDDKTACETTPPGNDNDRKSNQ
ncbi:MAG TPA: hypothetical protein PKD52_05395 [Clostridiales bacterium]|nr:hypothetical protein [Clostridiales bacterium]